MFKIILGCAFLCYNPFVFADWIINLLWVALVIDLICELILTIIKD